MSLQPISEEHLDEDGDSPRLARADLLALVRGYNSLISDTRIVFTNDPIIVGIQPSGAPDYSNASSFFSVRRFNEIETADWSVQIQDAVGVTANISGDLLTVTQLTSDAAYLNITATRLGYATVVRRLSVFRSVSSAANSDPDQTPPPQVTGVSGVGGISTIYLSWNPATYTQGRGPGQVNIYGIEIALDATVIPTFTDPGVQLIDTADGYVSLHSIPAEPSSRWILWLKHQSRDGVESILPSDLVVVRTTENPQQLQEALFQLIGQSELQATLAQRVDLIDGPASMIGSVSQRVLEETTNRNAALLLEAQNRAAAIAVEVQNRIAAINALSAVKNRIFYSDEPPVSDVNYTLQPNDTWYDTNAGNTRHRWDGSQWTLAENAATGAGLAALTQQVNQLVDANQAQIAARESLYAGFFATAGNEYRVFNQESQPVATAIGDIWTWKTGAGVETFRRWSGSTWVDSVSNKRPAEYLGDFPDNSLPSANLVIGDVIRNSTSNQVMVWNGSSWQNKTVNPATSSALIERERVARTTADSAEAAERNTLAVQLRGNYQGNDLGQLTSGLVYQERLARVTAVSSEALKRDSLYSGISGVLGTSYEVYVQPSTPTAERIGDVWSWDSVETGEIFRRWDGSQWVDSLANQRAAVYKGAVAVLPSTDLVIGDIARLTTDNQIYVFAGSSWTLRPIVNDTTWALVEQESQTRATQIQAEASQRDTLAAQLRGAYTGGDLNQLSSGLIFLERQARVTGLSAEAFRRESLSAGLQASIGTDYRTFSQEAQPTATKVGDIWSFQNDSLNIFRRWNGTSWVDSTDRRPAEFKGTFASGSFPNTNLVIGDTLTQQNPVQTLVWNGSSWIAKVFTNAAFAAVENERLARNSAIESEATERNTLAAQLRGGYTGTDLSLVTSGLIFEERQARASQYNSLVSRVLVLEAGTQSVASQFSESWAEPSPLSRWEITDPGFSDVSVIPATNGQSGFVLRIGNNADNDQVYMYYAAPVPFLSDTLYKITIKARKLAGNGVLYSGFVGVSSDGITLVNINGDNTLAGQHYGSLANLNPTAAEGTWECYFKRGTLAYGGTGTISDPILSHPNVRYIRPLILANYPNTSGIFEVTLISLATIEADASALESQVTSLTTQINHPQTGLLASATRINSLESSVYNPNSSNNPVLAFVQQNYSTTAQVNQAIATSVNTVNSRLESGGDIFNALVQVNTKTDIKSANFVQPNPPTSNASYTLRLNDTWIDTSNGRVLKVWDGASWQISDDIRIGQLSSQITTIQSSIQTSGSFDQIQSWDFNSSSDGWIGVNASISNFATFIRLSANNSDPVIVSPVINIQGSMYDRVRMRIRRVAGAAWEGNLYYTTANHGILFEFRKTVFPDPTSNEFVVVEWNMSALTEGGNDWINSQILQLRFDLGMSASDVFDIDWIAVGRVGVAASSAVVQQEITTRASQIGHLAAQYTTRIQLTNSGRAVVGGMSILGTSSATQGPIIDFGINASTFWVGSIIGEGIPDVKPFIIRTFDVVDADTGLFIPKGVYMDSAYITNLTALWGRFGNLIAQSIRATEISAERLTLGDGTIGGRLKSANFAQGVAGWILRPDGTCQIPALSILGQLTASQINTNGLIIRDGAGNPILGAGVALPLDYAAPGTLNSDLVPSIQQAAQTSVWNFVTGRPADGDILNSQLVPSIQQAGQTASWTGVAGRPIRFLVRSRGNAATNSPWPNSYLQVVDTEAIPAGSARSYVLVRIQRVSGVIDFISGYDVFDSISETSRLATDLNNTPSSYVVVIYTFDEPFNNRLSGGLPAALYRCGASRAIFGSPRFRFRSSYILIGIAGCGEGNGFEAYAGDNDDSPDAWTEVSFQLQSGNLLVSGTGHKPRGLIDYGYTGDLNATLGAPAGTPVAGNFPGGNSAGQVESTANSALGTANSAIGTANNAQTVANNAQQAANNALAGLNEKLNRSAADIISAPLTLQSAGAILAGNATNGVIMSPGGLAGYKLGQVTFSINSSTGDVLLRGEIATGTAERSGNTMTGSGFRVLPDGTGCWGDSTRNITLPPGQGIRLNGPVVTDNNLSLSAFTVSITPPSGGVAQLWTGGGNPDISWSSGIVTATPSGGTPPYTYKWTLVIDTQSGDSNITMNGPGLSNTVSFEGYVRSYGGLTSAIAICEVKDNNGRITTEYYYASVQETT